MFFNPISVHELLQVTKTLKNSNACGFDNLSSNLLKKVIHYIVDPLVNIFNISLKTGIVPDKLKIAKITPVFKNTYNRLYSFCLKKDILIDSQYGFRKKIILLHML